MGYHVGAQKYKDEAVKNLSTYPNNCTIGIELTHINWDGEFKRETLLSAKELILDLSERYNLERKDVYRHFDITGKDCPHFFVAKPEQWEQFLTFVFNEKK
ncbi:hypothetical protein FACS189447_08010 [Spirochaetia bacterium]|nr:hypothetical protein FACS189447_08010 [Spirochaetia bacterium]